MYRGKRERERKKRNLEYFLEWKEIMVDKMFKILSPLFLVHKIKWELEGEIHVFEHHVV